MSARAVKKPLLSKVHRSRRRAFAQKFKRFDWNKVIFSDEKIFRVRPGGTIRCWRRKSESKYIAKYTVPTVQKAEGLMVWAAMNSKGRIVVRRCPPQVNAKAYQDILATALPFIKGGRCEIKPLPKLSSPQLPRRSTNYLFQQDGASPHRANTTTAWLKKNHIRRFNRGDWPAMSPDMNPIEHVWPIVLRLLDGRVFFPEKTPFGRP